LQNKDGKFLMVRKGKGKREREKGEKALLGQVHIKL
jgi:hypothetical protein